MRLGFAPAAGCDCEARVREMDDWGVAGTRANRATVEGWLRTEAARADWAAKARALLTAAVDGLFLNPTDPVPGLLDEALRRAEAKGATR